MNSAAEQAFWAWWHSPENRRSVAMRRRVRWMKWVGRDPLGRRFPDDWADRNPPVEDHRWRPQYCAPEDPCGRCAACEEDRSPYLLVIH